MKYFNLLVSLIIYTQCSGQAPLIKQWDFSYGGFDSDFILQILSTREGGFLVGGNSISDSSYEKTDNNYDVSHITYDFWIIKLDANGNVIWDKTLGGTDYDYYYRCLITNDSGVIAVGSTKSPVSGNITQPQKGNYDMWIVKLDRNGNVQWDKRYGGSQNNSASDIIEVPGGYVIGGQTNSPLGGDVSIAPFGMSDYWMVKIDMNGNKIWDKRFGGSDDESVSRILPAIGGGYLLAGVSNSPASGNKSQSNYVAGKTDTWIVKTDTSGNLISDKVYGSPEDEYGLDAILTADNNYLISATTYGNAGGDKSMNSLGVEDFWVVKIAPALNKIWDIAIGGPSGEGDGGKLVQLSDGNYLIAGTSYSGICPWKYENNNGPENTWIVKFDTSGTKIWDKTVLTGYSHNEWAVATELNDHCIVVANDGDGLIGNDKTDNSFGFDYWCIKYCSSVSNTPTASFTAGFSGCADTCFNFTNSSVNGQNFIWQFPGAIPSTDTAANPVNICYRTGGIYDVTLIATNGSGTDTFTIQNAITIYSPTVPVITNQNNTLIATPGFAHYQWYYNSLPVGTDSSTYNAVHGGVYRVTVIDSNGCTATSQVLDFALIGIDELNSNLNFIISPIPAKNNLYLELPYEVKLPLEVSIKNIIGEEILHEKLISIKSELDISKFDAGTYFMTVKNMNDFSTRRFSIMK